MNRVSRSLAVLSAALLLYGVVPTPALAAVSPLYLESVSFSDAGHGMLTGGFGSMTGFVSVTSNGGTNWRSVRVDPDTWYRASAFGEDAGAGAVARLWGGEALVTTDSGSTWATGTVRSPGGGFESRNMDLEGSSNGWIAGSDGGYAVIMTTGDGGRTWTETYEGPKYPPPSPDLDPPPTDAAMRAIDGGDAQTAWAVGVEWNAGSFPRSVKRTLIHKTTDGGSTWTTQGLSPSDPLANQTGRDVYAVSAVDSRTAFAVAGIRDMLYQTTDGSTWTWKYLSGTNSHILRDISMVSTSTGWAVGSAGRVYRTTDGWNTRTLQASGVSVTLRSVHAIDASRAWVVGDDETVLYTTDAGATWNGCRGNTAPSARITSPASGAIVTGTALSIEGTATDGVGVGVASVDVRVKRSDGKYWSGTGWQSTAAWVRASTSDWWDTWSYALPLDPGQNRGHTYSFAWRATDAVTNTAASADVVTGVTVDNVTVDVAFSERLATSTVSPEDFLISGASVSGASLQPGGTTVRLAVSGTVAAARYRVLVATGTITDVDGNGCKPYTWHFVAPGVGREAGVNRYETAIGISKATFAANECTNAVLATGEGFADALAAAGLAGAVGGPLLLTPSKSLIPAVTKEFARLGVNKVWMVGGPTALSAGVEADLKGRGYEVVRLEGPTRYGTAAAVAMRVAGVLGDDFAHRAFVVRGDGFADALAVSPAAAANGFPVLLTHTAALPAETVRAIRSLGITETVIAGGEVAVSSHVRDQLVALGANPVRKAGGTRYGTAVAVSAYSVQRGWLDDAFAGVATGRSFADALGGGVSAGARGGVLLLTDPVSLSPETRAFIIAHPDLAAIAVFGGTAAVSGAVLAQVAALL